MRMGDTEELNRVLSSLQNIADVEGAAVITRNGTLITSSLPQDVDGQKFAAMAASLVGASETVAALLKSFMKRAIIEVERGKLLALGAGPKTILVVLLNDRADIESLLKEIEAHRKDIIQIFK
ncbi:MAG: roadblock/LC7 domain-containing protein [Candidatus Freyarchaeota archaeon]|nr:roadblock/LC7 domain-containing protein [Candidatus Jordarchaeia archaeon]MBS7269501.1 roadblock/LC7 domain-containing protein [Candidatus Jordarchaeia archaeon]MBS7281462.1 roadblock/LC7 domain-containing protein [Candidatus Jordarchaeia archaeon]